MAPTTQSWMLICFPPLRRLSLAAQPAVSFDALPVRRDKKSVLGPGANVVREFTAPAELVIGGGVGLVLEVVCSLTGYET